MKLNTLFLPSLALGGAALLLLPGAPVKAYSLLGGSLSVSAQRDFRVFNNFADPGANDNTIPQVMFPGWLGAEQALWKGALEWSSEFHGDGSGDPTQNIGDGGANFEFAWVGNATSAGGFNDNIVSAIPSCGGALAQTWVPISDGWKIEFCDNYSWHDGPGFALGITFDIQGVGCHEFGHALGLGHSSVGSATMYFSTPDGNGQRSIATDDSNGVKAVYGVKSITKPHISSVSVSGSTVTISGNDFTASGNDVWFTRSSATSPPGNPVLKVTNVSSTGGGTQIVVTAPGPSGSGDVLVKKGGSVAHSSLSNAYPYDSSGGGGGGLTISSISPSTIDAVNPGTSQFVTITGSGFTAFTELVIDGQILFGIPSPFTVVDSSTITFSPPLVSKLGAVEVKVQEGLGSDTASITYQANSPITLEAGDGNEPVSVFGFTGVDVVGGMAPGQRFILGMSSTLLPSVHPKATIDIGAGFTDLVNLGIHVVGPAGYTTVHVAPPYGPGTDFWFQAVHIDISGGPPYPASNLQMCHFFF